MLTIMPAKSLRISGFEAKDYRDGEGNPISAEQFATDFLRKKLKIYRGNFGNERKGEKEPKREEYLDY
jgi:hypothetical protein